MVKCKYDLSPEILTKEIRVKSRNVYKNAFNLKTNPIETVKRMKKAVLIFLMLALVATPWVVPLSLVKGSFKTFVAPGNPSTISVAIDNSTQGNTILVRSVTLPSPLIIATLIIALVALFGAILSLYLRWRDRKLKK